MTVLVFVDPAHPDGRLADPLSPQLSVLDQGLTRGDGVFESALYKGGSVRKLEMHLARLAVSAETLDLTIPPADAWRAAVKTAVEEYDAAARPGEEPAESVVKLIATRGPESSAAGSPHGTAWVTVSPAPALGQRQRETGVDVLLLDRGYDSTVAERAPWLLMGAKTLSYAVNMAALRYARAQGADDVIFTSSDGRVLEGPTSTVLLATRMQDADGNEVKRLITPTLETGILPGTTQGAIFAAAQEAGWELGYGPVVPSDLRAATAVWLVSSVRLLTPVNSLDGEAIGTDAELTAELTAMVNRVS
ncbi:aminodeoxychorismate lyase [Zhihengliuella flava]|uniref:4-amino-4-deoxychorismate lyase n=1 Tax=Zhihengliuella flava TaxID=1285193 RepID=A0A931D873_9MICC|nr:aminodeoxychorismate lyase [Zhihengliuella flava]MBG6084217.1 4-amino-4-deoxychorismate lyase [Zhihengliuella flava]